MQVVTKTWDEPMDGTSTDWANLPTPMALEIDVPTGVTQMMIFVQMSRVQHDTGNVNTQFRIMAESTQVSWTNTGNATGWAFRPLSLNGVFPVSAGQNIDIEVQYVTESGTVQWVSNADGFQERQLTVLMF
ncbi:MAG: hypothetical protein V3T30_00725 [Thermodesulfobacteriota bacterium]